MAWTFSFMTWPGHFPFIFLPERASLGHLELLQLTKMSPSWCLENKAELEWQDWGALLCSKYGTWSKLGSDNHIQEWFLAVTQADTQQGRPWATWTVSTAWEEKFCSEMVKHCSVKQSCTLTHAICPNWLKHSTFLIDSLDRKSTWSLISFQTCPSLSKIVLNMLLNIWHISV